MGGADDLPIWGYSAIARGWARFYCWHFAILGFAAILLRNLIWQEDAIFLARGFKLLNFFISKAEIHSFFVG